MAKRCVVNDPPINAHGRTAEDANPAPAVWPSTPPDGYSTGERKLFDVLCRRAADRLEKATAT